VGPSSDLKPHKLHNLRQLGRDRKWYGLA
jgi:hypothetical protein